MEWQSFGTAFTQDYYADDPLVVAPGLLGCLLVHNHPEKGWFAGRIVETEAYRGMEDLACHASKGKTPRTATMFGPPGRAYVYLIYGMYDMLNVVTWPREQPSAVLIRAIEPVMNIARSTNGPGKLTQALDITRSYNGKDLSSGSLRIFPDHKVSASEIETTPRIGVDYAGEWAHKPWRYTIRGNPYISKTPKRSVD